MIFEDRSQRVAVSVIDHWMSCPIGKSKGFGSFIYRDNGCRTELSPTSRLES